jgi:prepilin-type N-terminal cleavage/methylation domain-containing protein
MHISARRTGFTIIELVVVIAIIALLAAILLPLLAQARAKGERLRCAAHLREFGKALNLYRSELGRYPDVGDRDPGKKTPPPIGPLARNGLANIVDLAEALVIHSLGRPESLFCPASVARDKWAPTPFVNDTSGYLVPQWKTGLISYIYMTGLLSTMTFKDERGQPTFTPGVESPDVLVGATRRLNRVNPRVVLAGDRTVELRPGIRNVAGSNHGRAGGWFCYTTGDVIWRDWQLLKPHPGGLYYWYWPDP